MWWWVAMAWAGVGLEPDVVDVIGTPTYTSPAYGWTAPVLDAEPDELVAEGNVDVIEDELDELDEQVDHRPVPGHCALAAESAVLRMTHEDEELPAMLAVSHPHPLTRT